VLDPVKQLPNDIGRFLHVVADLAIMSNAYASNYVQNIQNLVAGFYSQIDPKSAIWNKGLNVTQIPGLVYTPTQMDALTFAKFNVLRFKGTNVAPVLLHDRTAAIFNSDFTFLMRMDIHGLVIDTLCTRADQYEGQSTTDGLQMTAMLAAMNQDMATLQSRGYISKAILNIQVTQAQQNMGQSTWRRCGRTYQVSLSYAQQAPRARARADRSQAPTYNPERQPTWPVASPGKRKRPVLGGDRRVW